MTRVTIKDIAAEVGVSHTTVSYVLNGNKNQKISDKTRAAVLEAARKLKYVPNETARNLRKNNTECIAVALEKPLTHNRFNGILQGIREELSMEGYGLLLMDFRTMENKEHPEYLDSVLRRRTDGIIYISSDGLAPDCSKKIESYQLPFVGVDCCPEEETLGSVSFDFERGAFEIACRLLGEGAKKILYWHFDLPSLQEKYRLDGFHRALELYPGTSLEVCQIPYTPDNLPSYGGDHRLDDSCKQSLVQDILPRLSNYEENDAVVCGWGIMVKHLCTALYQGNMKQHKIAVLSDAEIPVIPNTKILTSRPGFIRGGRESARLLLAQIRGEEVEKRICLPPEPPTYIEL
ncbi:MAG: LacI family DNA-binding transcriptional regulator [Eubacteriales bacterium]|nr:LacI family DNA-binding transcriptional regulator [Eubacteriales bacterium]